MSASPLSDPDLVANQYRHGDPLQTRLRIHARYTRPRVDWPQWVLAQVACRGDERALDLGCGTGAFLEPMRQRVGLVVAADLSPGMLHGLDPAPRHRVVLDARRLALCPTSFDLVLANHMLYHLTDIAGALMEIRRVLRPGGRLLAATNSELNAQAWNQVVLPALSEVAGRDVTPPASAPSPFSLENGARQLTPHFSGIRRFDLESALVFNSAAPVLDYVMSLWDWYRQLLPPGQHRQAFVQVLTARVQAAIDRDGVLRVPKRAGFFLGHC